MVGLVSCCFRLYGVDVDVIGVGGCDVVLVSLVSLVSLVLVCCCGMLLWYVVVVCCCGMLLWYVVVVCCCGMLLCLVVFMMILRSSGIVAVVALTSQSVYMYPTVVYSCAVLQTRSVVCEIRRWG